MKQSNPPKKRLSPREQQRINTTKERHGENFFHENAKKAAKSVPTKFNSETGSSAANKRWEAYPRGKGTISDGS